MQCFPTFWYHMNGIFTSYFSYSQLRTTQRHWVHSDNTQLHTQYGETGMSKLTNSKLHNWKSASSTSLIWNFIEKIIIVNLNWETKANSCLFCWNITLKLLHQRFPSNLTKKIGYAVWIKEFRKISVIFGHNFREPSQIYFAFSDRDRATE